MCFAVLRSECIRVREYRRINSERILDIREMKDIEINSDKYTTIWVLFFLALALLTFVTDSYDLAMRHVTLQKIELWNYPGAVFSAFVAISLYRDHNLRKQYPLGVLGFCTMSVVLLTRIAAQWIKGSSELQQLLWAVLMILSIAASALILAEGVRWFRRRVKLA